MDPKVWQFLTADMWKNKYFHKTLFFWIIFGTHIQIKLILKRRFIFLVFVCTQTRFWSNEIDKQKHLQPVENKKN